ncbi:MAG: hypothetical protein AB7G93_16520 [Bdellovibrionales bacterium]
MRHLLVSTLLLVGTSAFAETQTFTVDYSRLPEGIEKEVVENMCLTSVTLDSSEDLARVLLANLYRGAEVKLIEKSTGSLGGGDLPDAYTGEYMTRTHIVKLDAGEAYPYGVYYATTITQYGVGRTRKAFEVEQQLLNYRHSAEYAEDSVCGNLKYIKD